MTVWGFFFWLGGIAFSLHKHDVTHISHPNKVKTKDFLFSFSE